MSLDVYLYDHCEASGRDHEVFSRNITHNLNTMADKAGIYQACWRPEELKINKACELIPLLKAGLARLEAEPDHFRQWNAPNGWGLYEHFVDFVRAYLVGCEENPTATIGVSR